MNFFIACLKYHFKVARGCLKVTKYHIERVKVFFKLLIISVGFDRIDLKIQVIILFRQPHQTTLTATLHKENIHSESLIKEYNCPVNLRDVILNADYRFTNINELSHIHYHNVFLDPRYEEKFENYFNDLKNYEILKRDLIKFGVLKKKSLLKSFLQSL